MGHIAGMLKIAASPSSAFVQTLTTGPKQNIPMLLAMLGLGTVGMKVVADQFRDKKKKRGPMTEYLMKELDEIANTPMGQIGGRIRDTAGAMGGVSPADLLYYMLNPEGQASQG